MRIACSSAFPSFTALKSLLPFLCCGDPIACQLKFQDCTCSRRKCRWPTTHQCRPVGPLRYGRDKIRLMAGRIRTPLPGKMDFGSRCALCMDVRPLIGTCSGRRIQLHCSPCACAGVDLLIPCELVIESRLHQTSACHLCSCNHRCHHHNALRPIIPSEYQGNVGRRDCYDTVR